jgi:hypothetical protein
MNTKIREMKRSNLIIAAVAVALLAISCGIGISVYAQPTSASPIENGGSTVDTQEQQPAPQTETQTDSDADAQLAESLKNSLSTSSDGLTEVTHPDGTVTVDLEGRFQNFSVAKINPDGTVTTACVSNAKEVDHFFEAKNDKATANKQIVKSSKSTRKARRKN